MNVQDKKFLSYGDVAEIFGVTEQCVKQWVFHGHIPHYKLTDGTVRFTPELLEGWLETAYRPVVKEPRKRKYEVNQEKKDAQAVA